MKWIKPDTLTKKSCYLILGIGIFAILSVHSVMPTLFYQMMSSHISRYISSIMRANTVSQSYIWRGNRIAFLLYADQDVKDQLQLYSSASDSHLRTSAREKLLSKLETQNIGNITYQVPGDGAIVATTYSMIYTERGDAFYQEEAADIASVLLQSGWLSSVSMEMDMVYSPVLGDDSLRVICFVMPFWAHNIPCYAVHMMDFTYILNLFEELESFGISDFSIFQDGRILYKNTDYEIDLDSYPDSMFHQLQYQTSVFFQKNGIDFMTLCSYEEENMQIAVHADRETLLMPYKKIILLIEFLLYGIILLLVVSIILLLRYLLKRLTILSQRIKRVIQGNYTPLPEDQHSDEIGSLTKNFNIMVQTIQFDLEQKIAYEKKQQQMQYSLLVSAIDPHFIYNTLNTITFLAHMGKTSEIAMVNTALIGTLKDRLAIKSCKIYDTLLSEKEVLAQYMVIQSYLCHNAIDYCFDLNETDGSLLIPKNILQPLVENSIKHGLLPHKDPATRQILDGKILIQIHRESSSLVITISDNGIGISQQNINRYFQCPMSEITETDAEHIGVYNIRKRLSYLYGTGYRLTVENPIKGGCTVQLLLPLLSVSPEQPASDQLFIG